MFIIKNFDALPVGYQRSQTKDQQRIYMQAYHEKMEACRKPEWIPTLYAQTKDSDGRMFGKHCFQGMERELRHTLARQHYLDIDIVNCHPVLLQHYCRGKGIPCPHLDYYILNRQQCFEAFMEEMKCSRDVAKMTYLQVVNDGGKRVMQFCKNQGFRDFFDEMVTIREIIMKLEPRLLKHAKARVEEKKKMHPGRSFSVAGSCVNILLCQRENQCLMAMYDLLQSREVSVGSLVFDGLMIHKPDKDVVYDLNELLRAMEQHVLAEVGVAIKIEEKPMNQGLDISETQLKEFDHDVEDHMNSFKTSYEMMKTAFERTAFRELQYYVIKVPYRGWVQMSDRDMEVYTSDMIINRNQEGEERFFPRWKKDPDALKFVGRGHYPPGRACPPGLFNTFEGFIAAQLPLIAQPSERVLRLKAQMLDQIRCCAGDQDAPYEWLLDVMASILQLPGKKTGCILGFISKEKGTGKTTVGRFMMALIGVLYAIMTAKPKTDIFGEFNSQMEMMHFVLIDECKNATLNEILPLLMDQATSSTINIHRKCKDLQMNVPSFANYWLSSNHFLTMASGDRRSFVFRTTTRFMGNKDHFEELYAAMEDPEFLRVMYDFFMSRNVTGMNLQLTRPLSATMTEMEIAAAPLEIKFLVQYLFRAEGERPEQPISMDKLHKAYATFFRELAPDKSVPSSSSLGTQLKHLGLLSPEGPITKTTANHGRIHFAFDYDKVHEWMVSKRYMEPDVEPEV